jgi:hypothetical protein
VSPPSGVLYSPAASARSQWKRKDRRRVLVFALSACLEGHWRASAPPCSFWPSLRPKLWRRFGHLPTDTHPEVFLRAHLRSHVRSQEPAMAASNISLNSQPNFGAMRANFCLRHPAETVSIRVATCAQPVASARVAVVGNHLPRQCGIATFHDRFVRCDG